MIRDMSKFINTSWERTKKRIIKTWLSSWLSSFNTDSATECFTAIQQLKEKMNERKD